MHLQHAVILMQKCSCVDTNIFKGNNMINGAKLNVSL